MPNYEYRCDDCGHRFEAIKRLAEYAQTTQCPECGLVASKQPSSPAFRLVGSGFHVNDYKKRDVR